MTRINFDELQTLGNLFYESGAFPDIQTAAQAMIKILCGSELGFDPITSMSAIHFINGKPVLSAAAQAALIKDSGKYDFRIVEHSAMRCNIELFSKSEAGEWQPLAVEEFTIDDAKRAGLTSGANREAWDKHPKNMLFARCVSNALRFHCADLLHSEIGDPEEGEPAEFTEQQDKHV